MSRILVIDDDPDLRRGVRAALTVSRHEVIEAATATEGLQYAGQYLPDLVLCDFNLGADSGLDLLAQLRQNSATATLPLILITASDDESVMRRSMDLGADDFLHKPFTGPQLLAAVTARLKKQDILRAQAKQALQDIEARHRLLFENSADAVMVLAPPMWKFVEANAATLRIFGSRTKAEFLAVGPGEVSPEHQPDGGRSAERARTMIEAALRDGSHFFEWTHRRLDGELFPATVLLARLELAGQTLLQATVRDVTEPKRTELLLKARAELAEIAARTDLDGLLQAALDRAEQLTGSCIGFFHFVDGDQENLTLQTWSTNTLRKMCSAEGKGRHYPISHAGVWVDCIRTRTPVIHNDYASLPHRKGLPPGHAPVVREAVVPILRNGLVVCLLGVGNKPTDYTAEDVKRLEDLASIVADYAIRLRTEQALQESERRYQTLAETSPAGVFRTDARGQTTYVNTRWCELAGLPREQALGEGWLQAVHPEDRAMLMRGWTAARGDGGVAQAEYRFLSRDGAVTWVLYHALPERDESGRFLGYVGTVTDITERKRVEEQLQKLSLAVEQSPASVVITDTAGRIEYVNPKFCAVTGYAAEEVLGRNPRVLKSGDTPPEEYRVLWQRLTQGQEWRGEFHNRKKNGELYWEFAVISPIKSPQGQITHFLAVKEDITERKRTDRERDLMEIQLRHAQKLESIGQLAAGIAHEINSPMQYIGDNTRFLQDAFGELRRVVAAFQGLAEQLRAQPGAKNALAPVELAVQAADVDYLVEEIPRAIDQSLQGVERVIKIVRAMKEFSHPGVEQKTVMDLNHAIESTLTVARNEWKYVADLERDFDPDLPLVPCLPGEFNQVILNLLINAAHAIADVVGPQPVQKGKITVRTKREADWVEIRITDTGTGIPEAIRDRVFDPFFTTKPVGKGSGQGLAIARSVIVDKHGGTLTFETESGRGTCFVIRLPTVSPTTASSTAFA